MPSPANNYKNKPKRKHPYWSLIIVASWLALAALLLANRQNLFDWWQLRNYKAPAVVSQLASEDTMTPYAIKIFEVNHPAIDDKTAFNKYCPNDGGEQTIVLGCYHSDQAGIFVLNVSDPLLLGVEQVTAAHEMLHAAYDRLSTSERNKIDAMLLDYYNNDLKDPRILSTIAAYKRTEPNAVVNEMHSVFGTEVANLPAPLEQYYKKYFTDRHKITSFAAQYQSEFTSKQNEVSQDDSALGAMKTQIASTQSDLSNKLTAINSEQSQLSSYKNSNNIFTYNSAVPGYNQKINSYNAEIVQLKNIINSYNTLVDKRNGVALVENKLYQELSGNTTPPIN